MAPVYEQERELQREMAAKVSGSMPDVEVLAVELRNPEQVCVYLDSPSGVDIALCEEVTGVLREYLDRYALEVSSPGIERPLRTPEHFAQVIGRRVALRTAVDVDGRKRFRGEVVEAGERAFTVRTADETAFTIPYEAIVRSNLIDEG